MVPRGTSVNQLVMPKATNNFVWVIRDKTESEKSGLMLPGTGKEKPNTGEIISVGTLVKDGNIKSGKGKRALFHKGSGQEISYKDETFLVLIDQQIIGVD
jgi:chaperonin GroES